MYRGLVFNLIYNLLFVLTGYIMHFFLGSVMTPAEYGIIGTIITILDFEYLFLNNGVRQSLSKELSKNKYNIQDLLAKSLFFQIILIAVMFSINYFGAPLFSTILNDDSLSIYLKFVAFIIPVNGLYVLALGINDGTKHFVSSAWIGIFYAIAKLSVIPFVLFVFNDDPVKGTISGFLFAITIALIVGVVTLLLNKRDLKKEYKEKIVLKSYIHDTLNFSVFFIIVSVVLSVDTLVVKSIVTDKDMAGFYTGAVNFSKVSYFLLSAFFTIILPTATGYYVFKRYDDLKLTIKKMLMIITAFILPITVVISASSGTLLTVFYDPKYAAASLTLSILAFSHFFIGVTVMINMIISATNEKRFSSYLALAMLVADIILCITLTTHFGIVGTAISSILCTFVAMLISALYMKKRLFNILDKDIIKLISANLILWLMVYILFSYISVPNIIWLGCIYVLIYLVTIGLFFVSGLLKKELLLSFLKKGTSKQS